MHYLRQPAPRTHGNLAPSREALALHRRLPGYARTPLLDAPSLATTLGVGQVVIKDESSRMGLPAFKILGASWAVYRALLEHAGGTLPPWNTLDELRDVVAPLRPLTLAAATDGNHGRAVAWMARHLGCESHIFVPEGTAPARIAALEGEGAQVSVVAGSYDDAVAQSAALVGPRCLVISDTAWPGYDQVPRWVIDGYATMLWEVEDELVERGEPQPDVVVVQIGVGALAAAVVRHYRRPGLKPLPTLIGVEPTRAACVLASMQAGHMVTLPGYQDSIMAGLNCGTPSPVAWPEVSTGIDLYLAVEDERTREAMRALAAAGITAGETGAAGVAGLLALHAEGQADWQALGIGAGTRVLALVTEGATDPQAYARIVGTRV